MYLDSTAVTNWQYPMKTSPISYRTHFKYWTRVLLQLFLLTFRYTRGSDSLQYNNLQTLARNLPGCYSKIHQSYKYDQTAIPIHKLQFLFRSDIYKLASPMFNDSVTFYFQDFSKSTTKPVRSGFYSFSAEMNGDVIRMRTFHINGSVLVTGVCRTGEHVVLNQDVMTRLASKSRTFDECDMFWRRLDDGTFVGITGPLCLGSLHPDLGRIGVSVTLSKDQLLITEGWYRITNKLRLAEVKISYVLQNSLKPDVYKHGRQKSHNSDLEITTHEKLPPSDIPSSFSSKTPFWNKTVERFRNKINQTHRDEKQLTKKHGRKGQKVSKRKILRNFEQIVSALTSGYEVHFLIDLSMCSTLGKDSRERLSFAGRVKNFVYVRQNGGKNIQHGFIDFLTQKNGVSNQGALVTVRYVTLLSDGRVKVQILKTHPGHSSSSMMLVNSFQCRLSQGRIPYGGARFTLNPTYHVSAIKDFKTLTRSVSQGRDLHVVVDLSGCRGSNNRSRHVIGSLITDFDLVNGGKMVELFIPSLLTDNKMEHTHHVAFQQGFMGRVHRNGDVNLTFISNSQSQYRDNILSSAYHCKLSNDKTVTRLDDSFKGVRMFHNK